MTNLFDALEICLQEMERGADLDSALARFPEHAGELRPILETAIKARSMAPDEPSPDAVKRSRARVLQRAAGLRESKAGARRRVIPAFSRLAISFALTALFLASGAGLVNVSASALPGENLYPVKRSWENIRLFFIFDPQLREMMRDEFENERLHEVNELLAEGRHELIQFAGVYMRVNGIDYVSGVKVVLPEGAPSLANGDAVIVSGRTNARGFIEISSIEILPKGSVVPLGNPIEVEVEAESESTEGKTPGGGSDSGSSRLKEYELNGILQVVSENTLLVNGLTIILDQTKIVGRLCVGMEVEVKGYYAADGSFVAQEVKGKGRCAGDSSSGPGSDGNSNSNSGGSNENTGSGNSNGDDSGGNDNSNDDSGEDNSNDDSADDDVGDNDNGGDDD